MRFFLFYWKMKKKNSIKIMKSLNLCGIHKTKEGKSPVTVQIEENLK